MKKITIALTLLVANCLSSEAVIVQTIHLKNGSVLDGYVQKEDNNENIVFSSDKAIICISGKDAEATDHTYSINDLDKAWIEWAEENDAFDGVGDNRTLVLSNINYFDTKKNPSSAIPGKTNFANSFKIDHRNVSKVRLLERGTNIKYIELTPNIYTLSWDDVESITSAPRPKTMLSGIDRVYQIKGVGERRGKYAGEAYNTLSLYNPSGVVETYDINDVEKYSYVGINPTQDIFEQSELIDVVRTNNNGVYRGIIIERNFTDGNQYIVLKQDGGATQMLRMENITEYTKEENPKYAPKLDVVLKPGEIVINRMPTGIVGVSKYKDKNVLLLDSVSTKVIIPKSNANGTKVTVEYYNPNHLSSENFMLVKLKKVEISKKEIKYGFSTDIYDIQKYSPVSTETSVNHTTKLEYILPGSGTFALYDIQAKTAIPFRINQ